MSPSKAPFLERLALAAARRRPLLKAFKPWFPEVAELEVQSSLKVSLYLKDMTGPSYYLNHGGPAAFYHYEEAEKAEILAHLPAEGVFLDIGANIGLFAVFFARYFPKAKVFAFEPHPVLHGCLERTCERNGLGNLVAENQALGAREQTMALHLHERNSGGHSLHAEQIGELERGRSVEVAVSTLDAFARARGLARMDVLKIDVQGAEWEVFAGGAESLARFKPAILVEVENDALAKPEGAAKPALELLAGLGYRIRLVGRDGAVALSDRAAVERLASGELQAGHLQSNYVLTATSLSRS